LSPITTHVLDTAAGRPAAGVGVVLEVSEAGGWRELARGRTDGDGRCRELLPEGALPGRATHRLVFETGAYFAARGVASFHPLVVVVFEVREPVEHHHVPLLLSPFGYTTYRGS
jgi:5-hydroxyisourate hydrolase